MTKEKDISYNFWRLFHSFIRSSSDGDEKLRAHGAMLWAGDNLTRIRGACDELEGQILGIVWNLWYDHRQAPSLSIINDVVLSKDKMESVKDALSQYEAIKDELVKYDEVDLDQVLNDKNDEYELIKLTSALKTANRIAHLGEELPKSSKRLPKKGARDAINYLLGEIQKGIINTNQKSMGGSLRVVAPGIEDDYYANEKKNQQGSLVIKTNLTPLDAVIGGFKRGMFWGVLGFAGTFKSTLCRSLVYEAVQQGFNVMHIPLEQTFEEERNIYGIMHSHHPKFSRAKKFELDINAYDNGALTEEEKEFLFAEVIPDLQHTLPGELIIRQLTDTTWNSIKAQVELQHQITPIHLVLIDYLTLVDVSGDWASDSRSTMNNIIKDVKRWALNFNNGEGICVLTPVQGNRSGFEAAADNDGEWSMSGVSDYSEFDKSLDGCISTFNDKALSEQSRIKLSTAKVRRSKPVPVFEAHVDAFSRKIQDLHMGSLVVSEAVMVADDIIDSEA